MSLPLVNVLLSTYNGEKYISQQVESIMEQKDVRVICTVRDDGSTDGTKDILCQEKDRYGERLEYSCGNNVGFAHSFITLVKHSVDAPYYAFSDQDDCWEGNKLSACIDMIDNDDIPVVCYCNAMIVDSELRKIRKLRNDDPGIDNKVRILLYNTVPGCTMVFNKKAKEFFVNVDENNIEYHDHWLITLCAYFGKVIYCPYVGVLYRQHGNNQVGVSQKFFEKLRHRLKVLKSETHDSEKIASELLRCFGELMSDEDRQILTRVEKYRKIPFGWLKLLRNKNISVNMRGKKWWLFCRMLMRKL